MRKTHRSYVGVASSQKLEGLTYVSPRPNISSKDHVSIVDVERAGPFLRKRSMRNMYIAKGRCLTGSFVPTRAH